MLCELKLAVMYESKFAIIYELNPAYSSSSPYSFEPIFKYRLLNYIKKLIYNLLLEKSVAML